MLKWILYPAICLGALLALVAIAALVGLALPKTHRASRTETYARSPGEVFAMITDVARYPQWRADVSAVDVLPDDGQGMRFREHGKNGAILYRIEVSDAPRRMVSRIADPSLAFGGTWTFELQQTDAGGTALTITEDGEVYNPIFRVMSRLFFPPTASIERYLAALH